MDAKKYMVCLEGDDATGYSAYAPDLPGCVAAGETREECLKLMSEAMWIHLESMKKDGDPIPEPATQAEYVAPTPIVEVAA
jgi:predicted RNase H-like HicB family nuclease